MKKIHTLIKGFRSQHPSISSYDPRLHSVAFCGNSGIFPGYIY